MWCMLCKWVTVVENSSPSVLSTAGALFTFKKRDYPQFFSIYFRCPNPKPQAWESREPLEGQNFCIFSCRGGIRWWPETNEIQRYRCHGTDQPNVNPDACSRRRSTLIFGSLRWSPSFATVSDASHTFESATFDPDATSFHFCPVCQASLKKNKVDQHCSRCPAGSCVYQSIF